MCKLQTDTTLFTLLVFVSVLIYSPWRGQWWGIFRLCCCCLFSSIVYSLSLNVFYQVRVVTVPLLMVEFHYLKPGYYLINYIRHWMWEFYFESISLWIKGIRVMVNCVCVCLCVGSVPARILLNVMKMIYLAPGWLHLADKGLIQGLLSYRFITCLMFNSDCSNFYSYVHFDTVFKLAGTLISISSAILSVQRNGDEAGHFIHFICMFVNIKKRILCGLHWL